MSHVSHRRWFGLVFGTLTGLLFILVSQTINPLFLPGVPLYQPPFGMWGNILAGTLLGLATGGLVAFPDTGVYGVLFSSLLGAIVISAATLATGQNPANMLWTKITATLLVFVPVVAALVPFMILFRWVFVREETYYREAGLDPAGAPRTPLRRVIVPAALLVIAVGFGSLALMNDLGRAVLPRMNTLIRQGQQAQTAADLPVQLRPPAVNVFLQRGRGPYTLEWDKDETNRFQIPRPATPYAEQSIVLARFADDYILVCMFPSKTGQPDCKDLLHGQPTGE